MIGLGFGEYFHGCETSKMVGNAVVKPKIMFHSNTPKFKTISTIFAPVQTNMNHTLL